MVWIEKKIDTVKTKKSVQSALNQIYMFNIVHHSKGKWPLRYKNAICMIHQH